MKTKEVKLESPASLNLETFIDSSYRDLLNPTGKSLSGSITTVGGQIVKWWIRTQDMVALSITEAEYIANCEGAKNAACLRQLFQQLSLPTMVTPVLYTNSKEALRLSKISKFQ